MTLRSKPWIHTLLDFVAPQGCLACDEPLINENDAQHFFCQACVCLVEPLPHTEHEPATHHATFFYRGPLAEAIRRMKFNGRRDLAPRLGELLAAHSGRYLGRIDSVVPIPLHEARLHKRGFNQSALIAREVASFLHVNLDTHTLKRTRYALPQVRQRASERAQNIQDAFAATPLANTIRAVLLIDDVTTTGATLRAAHQALLDAGATTVYTLALAQTAAPNGNFTTQSN